MTPEVLRLQALVSNLATQFGRLSPTIGEKAEEFIVTTAWMRLGVSYAHGIVAMLNAAVPDATMPTERALFELYVDFMYLWRHGNPTVNARRVRIAGALELRDHLASGTDDTGLNRRVDDVLNAEQADNPNTYAEVRGSRKTRRFHWTGLPRADVGKAVFGDDYRAMYRIMSWEAHAIMTAIRDLDIDVAAGRIQFLPFENGHTACEGVAYRVGGYLFYMYQEYARQFELPSLDSERLGGPGVPPV